MRMVLDRAAPVYLCGRDDHKTSRGLTGFLRFYLRHPTGSLYFTYGYFMRGWGFVKRFGDGWQFFLTVLRRSDVRSGRLV